MATKRVFNPGDQPVVIDAEGHTLGGGEWADLDTGADHAKNLLDREQLLIPADSKPSTTKTKE
jgi:hypothetical protein